jgi:hypothetical protein
MLHVDLESKLDVARGLATADPPVLRRNLAKQYLHMIPWDAHPLEIRHDRGVEVPLPEPAAGTTLTLVVSSQMASREDDPLERTARAGRLAGRRIADYAGCDPTPTAYCSGT